MKRREGSLLAWSRLLTSIALAAALVAGCVVYEPVPVSVPSVYDRAWSAAQGALQDIGVQVTSSDRTTGVVRGRQGDVDVTVTVVLQADGRTQVRFDAKDSQPNSGLANRFSEAYDRRMGR